MTAISLTKRRRPLSDQAYAWSAFGVYVAALIALGILGFLMGLEALRTCVNHPTREEVGSWLLGLSWLGNPAVWASMLLLGFGLRWWAALAGVIALLFATCAVSAGLGLPGYYLWIASMVLVVVGALRVPRSVELVGAAAGDPTDKHDQSTRRRLLGLALAVPLLLGVVLMSLKIRGSCTIFAPDEYDANENVYTGEDARSRTPILAHSAIHRGEHPDGLPESARDFWVYDGGSFDGSNDYCTFTCGSRDDCLKAVEYIGGIRPAELEPWKPSKYAVVMEGPGFYSKEKPIQLRLRSNPWDVRGIKIGVVYEESRGYQGQQPGDYRMSYYAIDFDTNRVFYHHESGGFPTDEYRPSGQSQEHNAKRLD